MHKHTYKDTNTHENLNTTQPVLAVIQRSKVSRVVSLMRTNHIDSN